jgi:hypothetical protein
MPTTHHTVEPVRPFYAAKRSCARPPAASISGKVPAARGNPLVIMGYCDNHRGGIVAQRIYWFDDDAAHLDVLSQFIVERYPDRRYEVQTALGGRRVQYLEHLIATALEPAKPRQRA